MLTLVEQELIPAQQSAAERLLTATRAGHIAVLRSSHGMGRTTLLRALATEGEGVLIDARDFMGALSAHPPAAIEEAFLSLLDAALARHRLVVVDDFHLITAVVNACDYNRTFLLDVALTAILDQVISRNLRLVFGTDHGELPRPLETRAIVIEAEAFTPEDYEDICRSHLGAGLAGGLDYTEIHRFAPELNAHQIRNACVRLRGQSDLDTRRFTEYLSAHNMTSNVELEQVESVDWTDLKGFDDVIEALETKIALPLENRALAAELQLKPKRGVLLSGPPGTGKTSIGRALASRLKSKFFLIDGTVIAGTYSFYNKIRRVFDAAKRNGPAVVFIDDADLIFESEGAGFYRYLLTMLDGLESASAKRVCVIITAMEPRSLPPALLRSGRIELWLETRLPDLEARVEILRDRLRECPMPISDSDIQTIADAADGLTGADLRAVVDDGKLLFAKARTKGESPRPAERYFLEAVAIVRDNRRNYLKRRPRQFMESREYGFIAE